MRKLLVFAGFIALSGCATVGTLGIVTRSKLDSAEILRSGRQYKEIGLAEGKACRHFLLAVLPWGDADIQTAVDRALMSVGGGDALINVTTQNSLYGYIPIYNVYAQSCTTVKGTAVRFEEPAK